MSEEVPKTVPEPMPGLLPLSEQEPPPAADKQGIIAEQEPPSAAVAAPEDTMQVWPAAQAQ